MAFEFDPVKEESNLGKHGVRLSAALDFEWETAIAKEDQRRQYAEPRFEAIGYIGNRLHVLVYCLRADALIAISLRKANSREENRYAKT